MIDLFILKKLEKILKRSKLKEHQICENVENGSIKFDVIA